MLGESFSRWFGWWFPTGCLRPFWNGLRDCGWGAARCNVTNYDRAGEVSDAQVDETLGELQAFKADLIEWLKTKRPNLLKGERP